MVRFLGCRCAPGTRGSAAGDAAGVYGARNFHIESSEALPLVRELGIANFATGVVGLASLRASSFVLPVAISAAIFYGVAGIRHVAERGRSRNETVAWSVTFGCSPCSPLSRVHPF
jgi:hypothetical protein